MTAVSGGKAMENPCRVFVYGTLKPGERYYNDYCAKWAIAAKPGIVFGCLYALPLGYPALVPGDRPVRGVVLTFAEDGILQTLDELEDYDPRRSPHENEYHRRQTNIFTLDHHPLGTAWVYWMNHEQVEQLHGSLCTQNYWTEIATEFS